MSVQLQYHSFKQKQGLFHSFNPPVPGQWLAHTLHEIVTFLNLYKALVFNPIRSIRLRVVPHFSSRDSRASETRARVSRGVIFTRASLALLSLRKNGGLLVVYNLSASSLSLSYVVNLSEYFECLTTQSVKSDRQGKLLITKFKRSKITPTHNHATPLLHKLVSSKQKKCLIHKNKPQKFRATRYTHLVCFVSTINYHFHLFIVSVQTV